MASAAYLGASMKCPKCGRDTYSKKWGTCTACSGGAPRVVTKAPEPVTKAPEVIVTTTFNVTDVPTNSVTPVTAADLKAAPMKKGSVTVVTPSLDGATSVTAKPIDNITTVTHSEGTRYVSVQPLPGEECPTCHRKMPSKNALKQAAWRSRDPSGERKA